PERAAADDPGGQAGRWLLVERNHVERLVAGGRTERLARQDVAEASFGPVGLDAEQRNPLRMLADEPRHSRDVRAEPALVADVVIARKEGHRRVRLPAGQGQHAEEPAGALIAIP